MKWQLVFLLLMGFSLGDELGFRESLSNVESTNRRSVDSGRSAAGYFQPLLTTTRNPPEYKLPVNSMNISQARSVNGRSSHSVNLRAPGSKYSSVPLIGVTVPPFKPIHPAETKLARPVRLSKEEEEKYMPATVLAVPAFAALPDSIAKVPTFTYKKSSQNAIQNMLQNTNRRLALTSLQGVNDMELSNSLSQMYSQPGSTASTYNFTPDSLFPDTVSHALKSVSQTNNVTADSLLASMQLRQQQLLLQRQKQLASLSTQKVLTPTSFVPQAVTTTSTTTTPTAPTTTTELLTTVKTPSANIKYKYTMAGSHKVMNAPKEYYPISYDKNFDDNFTSRVELPDTSFSCGNQKHFPGLYADEDLNCMVFHVCAFTDDGLVMKSFLCPESTLFDQTILKCNWWFYVDCKASKKLYDSNIPISKSYQLMKALAFFSSYSKNEQNSSVLS